ncbi:hypothetical protein Dsin_013803 [Dipteronia sinensis]|uniref:RNase H type-1 domain-containing protein n=1 Tax=Dipteronia sinensis TaxID=43782 RepID=A0AAE0E979_9ROSI|nr:hypothetical protein Dsin_013803 [Dipteronia sinensis]
MVAWKPLCVGCVKLNVDGGCNVDSGAIYAWGVIRDHLRNWVRGFVLNMGAGTVFKAEFWGLFEGPTMAWNTGFSNIIVESNSLTTVQIITKETNPNHPFFSLIESCKRLINAD